MATDKVSKLDYRKVTLNIGLILFGIIAVLDFTLTSLVLVLGFALFVVIDGTYNVIYSFINMKEIKKWWKGVISGVISVLFGIMAFVAPDIFYSIIIYLFAISAVFLGFVEAKHGIKDAKTISKKLLYILFGLLSLLFGIWMFAQPYLGGTALVIIAGIYAIFRGSVNLFKMFHSSSGISASSQ